MDNNLIWGQERPTFANANDAFEHAVQTRVAGEVEDWPNEAGFEGLTEVRGPVELEVIGSIPRWAAGSLYRTGPGGFDVKNTPKGPFKITHWFDGFAHTHRFKIFVDSETGQVCVEYRSRHQAEEHVAAIRELGAMPGMSFGQKRDPCLSLFAKAMCVFRHEEPTSKRANICVAVHANLPGLPSSSISQTSGHRGDIASIHVTTDTNAFHEIDQETLEPIGLARQVNLNSALKGPLSSAHAQRDPITGDIYNFNLELGRYTSYHIFRTKASDGKTDIIATIRSVGVKPAYIHSFFLSPSFVILCIPSSHLGCMGASVPWNGNIIDAIEPFNESKLSKWFVIDRLHGQGIVATFDSPAGFFFHSVNAFEEPTKSGLGLNVYCDLIEYPTTDILRAYEMDVLLHTRDVGEKFIKDEQRVRNCFQRLVRRKFHVPTHNDGQVTVIDSEKIFEIRAPYAGELPTINPAYATKPYRYVYSLSSNGYSTLHDTIVKTDLMTQTTIDWHGPAGHTPGEAIFVPRPKDDKDYNGNEDDGILLSVILDGFNSTSYLLCLDAQTMKELGRAVCTWAIGHGFHGLHV